MAVENATENIEFLEVLDVMTNSVSSVREVVQGLVQKFVAHVYWSKFDRL
jgi:hypothetical protein